LKKIFSLILLIALVLGISPAFAPPVCATAEGYGSNGKFLAPIDPPAEGATPISDRAGLEAIASNMSGSYYLTRDIDLSGAEWTPIGYTDSSATGGKFWCGQFSGIFDGQGHVVKDITITRNTFGYNGLFGTADGANIINTGVEDTNINVDGYAGGICGQYSGTIKNCYHTGNISVSNSTYAYDAGGICGFSCASFNDCYNVGNISADASVSNNDGVSAGGICGTNNGGGIMNNCYNTGAISASCKYIGYDSTYISAAGGICGKSTYSHDITDCYNTGNCSSSVTGAANANAGGICGYTQGNSGDGNIRMCYNTGLISAYSHNRCAMAGGIDSYGVTGIWEVSNCYNTGTVSAVSLSDSCYVNAGGILGFWYNSGITNCYNVGNISASAPEDHYAGGITGTPSSPNGCYCLDYFDISSGVVFSIPQMKDKSSFTNWDFTSIWAISPGINNGYPYLQSFPPLFAVSSSAITIGGEPATTANLISLTGKVAASVDYSSNYDATVTVVMALYRKFPVDGHGNLLTVAILDNQTIAAGNHTLTLTPENFNKPGDANEDGNLIKIFFLTNMVRIQPLCEPVQLFEPMAPIPHPN